MQRLPTPRSQSIEKTWRNLDWPSVFAAIIYPALGVLGVIAALALGLAHPGLAFHWWYVPLALAAGSVTLVVCNLGIGVLHRIWQHRAGELRWPAQLITAVNCVVAMQGQLKDWVNYHSQHHRLSDKPGDPHNPHESKFWAWIGWLLWRDENDLKRPLAMWLRNVPGVRFVDRHYNWMALTVHLIIPAAIYAAVIALGGSVLLTFLLHASAVTARGIQFHATTLGVNVVGHLRAPAWLRWLLAVLTGGEAIHGHHHEYPTSALHLPRKGLINRLVDYNGTMLLILAKLRLARDLKIAPQFQAPARIEAE
ncbi:acyl-CoA desaturase [Marinicauda salina]|uniref:Acyl-CoA desaturase n=1 Tax=Marinicauda salina TaxID=2135793 RepID=A0A2U2BWB0_9PROT|nr:acyl-CoA desaturase [Marinicauda salina]PWE18306.1 acyl-CoA desaturase [Marinicauda salina]